MTWRGVGGSNEGGNDEGGNDEGGNDEGDASDGRVSDLVEMSARQFHVISSHSAVSPLLSKFIK